MTQDILTVFLLLGACILAFTVNRPRMDAVALLALLALVLTGILTVDEALAGFSEPSVVLIAAFFVIGERWFVPAWPTVWVTGWCGVLKLAY